MVSTAIAQGNVQAINYFVAQKYIEAFKALAESPNQKFVLLPMAEELDGLFKTNGDEQADYNDCDVDKEAFPRVNRFMRSVHIKHRR